MIIRLILSAALLYGVYTETGIWTTILMSLMVMGFELNNGCWKKLLRQLKNGEL